MEVVCQKYNEKMKSENAFCAHPHDYCKFRSACVLHFMGQERENQKDKGDEKDSNEPGSSTNR